MGDAALPLALPDLARRQIEAAREYTLTLIDDIDLADWFRQPSEGVTHVAWQVGHLTMAQYMLTLVRLRGKVEEDASLISRAFLKAFAKGTTPVADPSKYPSPEEILLTLHRVHRQAMDELAGRTEADLQGQVAEPYLLFPNVLGSLFFCAAHEMLHAGQIGLVRRLLGKPTKR